MSCWSLFGRGREIEPTRLRAETRHYGVQARGVEGEPLAPEAVDHITQPGIS